MNLELNLVKALQENKSEDIAVLLAEYNHKLENTQHASNTECPSQQELTKSLLSKLQSNDRLTYAVEAWTTLRFMSRDKTVVEKCFCNSDIHNLLLENAKLSSHQGTSLNSDEQIEVFACKCVCNSIYLSRDSKGWCSERNFLEALVLKCSKHIEHSHDVNVLTLKLLFLTSALNPVGRKLITDEFDGRHHALNLLEYILNKQEKSNTKVILSTKDTTLCNEVLKVLFNLNMDLRRAKIFTESDIEDMNRVMDYCRIILLSSSTDPTLVQDLHCSTGNVIYSIPPRCMNVDILLLSKKMESAMADMSPIDVLLDILKKNVMNNLITTEVLQPLLALLSDLSRVSRDIRRYLKNIILPPRRDFKHRPEEGLQFRNKLIKLFTHNNTNVKQGVADFLFVLCKENVDRFVKYTGYGNAAGLLASRGLLAGGHGETVYSDTDDDSDTEEYKEVSHKINPVTGHVPLPTANPMEGMTDDQKEYLAAQLANDISKLSSANSVIQPMGIGSDGKLIPLRQVMESTCVVEESIDSD